MGSEPDADEGDVSRRRFLRTAALAALAVAVATTAASFLTLLRFLKPSEGFMPDWKGKLPRREEDGLLTFQGELVTPEEVTRALDERGEFIFMWYGPWHGEKQWMPGLIVRDSTGKLFSCSRKCTHEGCMAEFRESTEVTGTNFHHVWFCHCHDGVFDALNGGEVLNGPPPRPLPEFDVLFEDNPPAVRLPFQPGWWTEVP
jgi:Rieske Fe-S protein